MTKRAIDRVRIASPCKESWDDMSGDAYSRRCDLCKLQVFNLSALTADEADALLAERTGKRTCAHVYRRRDGTVLTKDCPRGLRDHWRRVELKCLAVAAVVLSIGAADAATGGPTAEVVSPAVNRITRFLGWTPNITFLGETADGEIDYVDQNL
ncbi:MAG: hypothetical protein KDA24_08635 [Deltaproteobacteria bacterium]|nr:hypothetical protein [Deltaproteobacteria bacterium]